MTENSNIEGTTPNNDSVNLTSLEDLTEGEKSISLVMINCLVKSTPNDTDLGKEIRKIFNTIKS